MGKLLIQEWDIVWDMMVCTWYMSAHWTMELFHRSQHKLNNYFENIPLEIFCQSNHNFVNFFYFKLKPKLNWRNAVEKFKLKLCIQHWRCVRNGELLKTSLVFINGYLWSPYWVFLNGTLDNLKVVEFFIDDDTICFVGILAKTEDCHLWHM